MQLPPDSRFHHLGHACRDLQASLDFFGAAGYRLDGDAFSDDTQGVRGCFLVGNGPRIELLENLPGRTTLSPWLAAGTMLYHMAYEVRDLAAALGWARGQRGRVVVPPVPASAFGGRRIAFVMFRHGPMLEFIDAEETGPASGA